MTVKNSIYIVLEFIVSMILDYQDAQKDCSACCLDLSKNVLNRFLNLLDDDRLLLENV